MRAYRYIQDVVYNLRRKPKTGISFDRPIFIISPPRSGSTHLFQCITKLEEIVHFGKESDFIWWQHFPYDEMEYPSDSINMEIARDKRMHDLKEDIFRELQLRYSGIVPDVHNPECTRRYLDKTIANCFRLHLIDKVFPNALFLLLIRDPRANISSMIEGWPFLERFGKMQLTKHIKSTQDATISHWTYPAPPGWQNMITRPLPEICAWSWQQHIEYILEFFDERKNKYLTVRYEELIDDPVTTFLNISKFLDLRPTDEAIEYVKSPQLSFTTVSEPRKDKWKDIHYREIISIQHLIMDTASKIGYDLDIAM